MGRVIGAIALVGVAVAGLLVTSASGGEFGVTGEIEVTKTVEGPGPDGPYKITVSCPAGVVEEPATFELSDGDLQTVLVTRHVEETICTVTEVGTQDAAVSYACSENAANEVAFCTDSQTVVMPGDIHDALAQVDITNTFPEPESEAEPAAAEAVEATPTFTG